MECLSLSLSLSLYIYIYIYREREREREKEREREPSTTVINTHRPIDVPLHVSLSLSSLQVVYVCVYMECLL
jgi:hypothetical protein